MPLWQMQTVSNTMMESRARCVQYVLLKDTLQSGYTHADLRSTFPRKREEHLETQYTPELGPPRVTEML